MKLHKNVLSDNSIKKFHDELNYNFANSRWTASSFFWQPDITVGIVGNCMSTVISDELKEMILTDIGHLLPKCSYHLMQIYVWTKNSGISLHNDDDRLGVTIYMNQTWDMDYGGIFLWQPKNESEFKVIVPEFNAMVVNDEDERHMVTPISPLVDQFRITIQIWGQKADAI